MQLAVVAVGLTSLTADLQTPLPCEVLAPAAENPGFVPVGRLVVVDCLPLGGEGVVVAGGY